MDKLLKYKSYKITIFHNDRERIKPGKQGVRNILRFIKNLKDIRCFLFCQATKLRLNFVHCFIQKISLSVLIRIGDLPSANVITELRWILKMQQVSCLFLSLDLFIKWTGSPDEYVLEGLQSLINYLCPCTTWMISYFWKFLHWVEVSLISLSV